MKARDIMTWNPAVVVPSDPVSRAAELMKERNVGLIPVVNDRNRMQLEGVLTDRDIAIRCVAEHHDGRCRVAAHMTTGPLDVVRPDTDVEQIIDEMERDQVRRVLVVEDGNRLAGIVAQADLALRYGPKDPLKVEEVLEAVSAPPTGITAG
jgi:CBS domain-containing protein